MVAVTTAGTVHFLASVAFIFVFSTAVYGFLSALLCVLWRACGGLPDSEGEDFFRLAAFVPGFGGGIIAGCEITLQVAIWLGFTRGDLPTLRDLYR